MIIADTSGLLALFNEREPRHRDVRTAVEAQDGPLIVSPYVVAELDYLVGTRIGHVAELAVLRELTTPGYVLADMDSALLLAAAQVVERHADQHVGATDASLVVLADRHRTDQILTLDRRHFTVLWALDGRPFALLPGSSIGRQCPIAPARPVLGPSSRTSRPRGTRPGVIRSDAPLKTLPSLI